MRILQNSFSLSRHLFVLALLSFSCLAWGANPLFEVDDVEFKTEYQSLRWNAFLIDITAGQNPDPAAKNRDYLDNVKVTFTIGYDDVGPKKEKSFYQSTVTLVTLEQSQKRTIAFFLPRDIVRRDNLPQEPAYWGLEFEVNGNKLPMDKDYVSSTIKNASIYSSFVNKAKESLDETEGILVPAHRSPYPYGTGERRADEITAVVWKDSE